MYPCISRKCVLSYSAFLSHLTRTCMTKCNKANPTQSTFTKYSNTRKFSITSARLRRNKDLTEQSPKQNKKKDGFKFSELRRLLNVAYEDKWKIGGAISLLCVSSAVALSVPYWMGRIIDVINQSAHDGTLMEKLKTICSFLMLVFALGALANCGRVYLMDIACQRVGFRIREKLFASIMKQDVAFFDKTKTGELISRLSSDADKVGNAVTFSISDGLRALAQGLGSSGMMVAEEKISNIRTVRVFTKEKLEVDTYKSALFKVLALGYQQSFTSGLFWGMNQFAGNMIILTVFYGGGYLMNESMITIGELSAFLMYAAYIGVSINGLSGTLSDISISLGASTRVWELIDRQPTIPVSGGLIPAYPFVGRIDFQDVFFTYPARQDATILSRMNLIMPAGSVTAVVGASGSGKTTIGNLLLRLYDPDQGSILLDGENIKNLDPEWLRNQIGVVSQEPALFNCSIADNIKYGANDPSKVTMEMVEEAAREAFADIFIKNFPQKYDTIVGEKGLMLSGGQKQRIALARAIIKNPKILLLDEATSALDSESEFFVKQALQRLMVGRTVVVIAHRLSTIRSADQIAVLNNGLVEELGKYSELTAMEGGIFRKLVEKQTITF
ncbi:ATP-binding cassette sub-family B member 10, mitochondrial-like isoform X2 [Dreissena polymorpha]|uniref:ATP-binding cassette sub-family B member 10, mitochondrial-like isoform X2 n=1 Tax=Dreissena polymorpha TaxID=45954 RepID=UPI0022653A98|nr:ATP-binding cassette sub-family B member 10, mitochondrial-like isoform X2 [Dreissena polymorpha]